MQIQHHRYRRPTCDLYPVLCVAYNTLQRGRGGATTAVVVAFMTDLGLGSSPGGAGVGGAVDPDTVPPPAIFCNVKFIHCLGAGSDTDGNVSSNVVSLRVVDERGETTRVSTGVWDDTDRFVPVEIVWTAETEDDDDDNGDGASGRATGVYLGLLDIDTMDAFERCVLSCSFFAVVRCCLLLMVLMLLLLMMMLSSLMMLLFMFMLMLMLLMLLMLIYCC